MSKLPPPSNSPNHVRRSENWAPAYIFIGMIPVVFVVAAVASVLLRWWQKKRRAAGGRPREDGQQPQDIELAQLAHLRRHWFPWREALQEIEGSNVPSSSPATAVTAGQFTQQPVAAERPRQMDVNPRLANKLAAKFEGRGGVWGSSAVEPTVAGPSGVRDDDIDTQSSVTQWPAPGLSLESAQKSESAPEPKPELTARVPYSHSFCHGYGVRRESDEDKEQYAELDRERNDEINDTQTEGNHIQTEGMAEVDLGEADLADGIDQEERQRQENERQRAIWRERIKSLTRDDDLLPLVRQDAQESKGRSPGRKLTKMFGFGRG